MIEVGIACNTATMTLRARTRPRTVVGLTACFLAMAMSLFTAGFDLNMHRWVALSGQLVLFVIALAACLHVLHRTRAAKL